MTTDQLTALWENVTVGQALVVLAAAWLFARLAEIVIDGVRALARRRTSTDERRDDELVEQVEQLRQRFDDYGHDLYQSVDAIRTDQADGREVLDEQLVEARAIRAACERIAELAERAPLTVWAVDETPHALGQPRSGTSKTVDAAAQTGDGA